MRISFILDGYMRSYHSQNIKGVLLSPPPLGNVILRQLNVPKVFLEKLSPNSIMIRPSGRSCHTSSLPRYSSASLSQPPPAKSKLKQASKQQSKASQHCLREDLDSDSDFIVTDVSIPQECPRYASWLCNKEQSIMNKQR